jgi:hypothetical protein
METNSTPTSAEMAFVLKRICHLYPVKEGNTSPVATITPSSTSFIKIINVPIKPDLEKKVWAIEMQATLCKELEKSLVGKLLAKNIKHIPCIMRNSPHTDSCTAWVDIHDTMSGTNAAALIGKFIYFGDIPCRIIGVKPHPGSLQCTQCQKWGHHSNQCHSQSVHCALCGGPHSQDNHLTFIKVKPDDYHCVNCMSSKCAKNNHASMDHKCLFWEHRFDCDWLKCQFKHNCFSFFFSLLWTFVCGKVELAKGKVY